MNTRWQCSVCGYIHVGDEPPGACPVCGADRSKFERLKVDGDTEGGGLLANFKIHPVAAHFPGGLLPTAVFFLALSGAVGDLEFEATAFWLALVATAVVPVSITSGLYEWKKHYGGRPATIFKKKIGLGLLLLSLGVTAAALRYVHPGLVLAGGWLSWTYAGALFGMLACVILLGHYGAILVYQVAQRAVPKRTLSTDPVDEWLKSMVFLAPEAILIADASGKIRFWNRGAERIFGAPAEKAIGQSLDLIVPERLRTRHWDGWGQVMKTGRSRYGDSTPLQVPALRGDGTQFSAEFSIVMIKNEKGSVAAVAAILRDVSAQREREKNLQVQLDTCLEKQSGT